MGIPTTCRLAGGYNLTASHEVQDVMDVTRFDGSPGGPVFSQRVLQLLCPSAISKVTNVLNVPFLDQSLP